MIANPQRLLASKEEPVGCCAGTTTAEKTADGREGRGGLTRSSAGGRNGERRRNPGEECSNIVSETSPAQEA
ncbi:hypothetical protein NDU88_005854 [Pleurodeles waltl]|uniref:Uncharacterized protein n=1 Tax=Pleurodeles waltl TaxID=8319 RepID=A0AAV7RKA7_PLEWA|nr:hypothetical protein NDU88_005854 [Pleurodeles waltl]